MPSLYVHIPFCMKKCDYCAFYSVPIAEKQISQYLCGVAREIELRKTEAPAGVSSLFLGGGTPTVLNPIQLDQVLREIHGCFSFHAQAEKTVEANPGTLTSEKLTVMLRYGLNRISLGVQSLNDNLLKAIGRVHTVQDSLDAVSLIRKAKIQNLNIDLMFGLPGQSISDWQATLRQAVALSPEHLSVYALTVEEGTPLGVRYLGENAGCLPLPDDDLQADMYELAAAFLRQNGYVHYEISNFCRPGFECLHNQAYWQSKPYLGIGPGAVSCLDGVRTKNTENLQTYSEMLQTGQKPIEPDETEILTREQLMTETIMLGLRTAQGVNLQAFFDKFQEEMQDIYGQIMTNYIDRNILIRQKGHLKVNPSYYFVANSILQHFVN